jgi:hypothetical protein
LGVRFASSGPCFALSCRQMGAICLQLPVSRFFLCIKADFLWPGVDLLCRERPR